MPTLQEAAMRKALKALELYDHEDLVSCEARHELRTALAQQGEQPTQRQLDTTIRQWETWKAYALELQAKLVKYEGGSPMLLNAASAKPARKMRLQ